MMIAFVYSIVHLVLGMVAALYWANRCDPQGTHVVKEFLIGLLAFIFWPLGLFLAVFDFLLHG